MAALRISASEIVSPPGSLQSIGAFAVAHWKVLSHADQRSTWR